MKTSTTYTNEFTGEVFTDKRKCEQAEIESKKYFIVELMGQLDTIKDICNTHNYCDDCPFNRNGDCIVQLLTDRYLEIVAGLRSGSQETNN
jgi:hypothetical protein